MTIVPSAGSDPPAAAFFASRDRTGAHPEAHLASFSGIMQADAYAGFNRLYAPGRKPGPIVEAGCFAHARRKLFDLAKVAKAPIAAEAVMKIDALFAIEREINGRSAAERLVVRRGRMRPIVDELEIWLIAQRAKLSAKSDLAKAITYSLKRWTALTRFLDDGRICMTNNAAERALRGVAIGRANWTFAGSDRGAQRAAAIYTLTETCKLNGVDPQAYLAERSSPDCPTTRPVASMTSCPGTGRGRSLHRPRRYRVASDRALPAVFTGCVRFSGSARTSPTWRTRSGWRRNASEMQCASRPCHSAAPAKIRSDRVNHGACSLFAALCRRTGMTLRSALAVALIAAAVPLQTTSHVAAGSTAPGVMIGSGSDGGSAARADALRRTRTDPARIEADRIRRGCLIRPNAAWPSRILP